MARPLRLESPGSIFHVVARGNNRIAVFRDDGDRETYLKRLAHYRERFGFRVLAYCLMSNHLHLAVRTGRAPLSRIMAAQQSSYTQWFNRRHRRSGHLFEGRYKAFLVQDDRYLLSLVRYIHENPVAAGIAERPQQYRWSSDAAYRGRAAPFWLDADDVLKILGASRGKASAAYSRMMTDEEGLRYDEVPAISGLVKGEEEFANRVLAEAEDDEAPRLVRGLTVERVLKAVAKELGVNVAELASPSRRRDLAEARSVAAYLGKTLGGIPWSRMARRFGRDGSTLVRNVGRLEQRMQEDEGLRRKLRALERTIREDNNT
jgi:REP element-mobilizing transposase RayT